MKRCRNLVKSLGSIKRGDKKQRVLAVASGGGHWIELLRLLPSLDGCDVAFATTNPGLQRDVGGARFYLIRDATRWNKLGIVRLALRLALVLVRERPDVIISTGAAPGYVAVRLGALLGVRTIWVDSIANVDELSLSGQLAGRHASLWLTQWSHLSKPGGPFYSGSVL